ncbi:hypothetical protein RhiirA5_417583 [Rhizophagus irregularis]|uniref:Uncharacterized protein n=1 Tax=Rhizophagus irregularis TaxID=588596 RepID=A0A2N0PM83_9GLOM|nr:hypothetical protein RhiirA5_417583 [Rhizophagus irregularis]
METPSTKREGKAFECLNDDVKRLILHSLYETCLRDFDRWESIRARQVKAVKKLLPLGYTSRSFAKLVLPYVWKYVRIVTNINSERSHNIVISEILKNDNLLFPYGEYLKELEINFTVCSGDERCHKIPTISSLLQVIAIRCANIQQLNFLAKVEHKNTNKYPMVPGIYDENVIINQIFQRYLKNYPKTEWNDFRNLVSKAFSQGSLVEVTLSSDFLLMDDECLINITKNNPGIRKLSLRGSQFTHTGIETALQYLGGSLRELEIYNLLGDGSTIALRGSPLNITIDSLLRPCRNLQRIHLVGIKYRFVGKLETYICPLQSITANQVDEETLRRLFSLVDKQTLSKVNITCPCDVVKWDSFLCSSILPFAKDGSLKNLILLILRCQNHQYSSYALDPEVIMKNITNTLQISETTVSLLRSKLNEWRILVGKDTGDQLYSVESEGVDFVSRTCILNYDRLALSEYCY